MIALNASFLQRKLRQAMFWESRELAETVEPDVHGVSDAILCIIYRHHFSDNYWLPQKLTDWLTDYLNVTFILAQSSSGQFNCYLRHLVDFHKLQYSC
jgi:hypothetical protein